MFIVRTSDENKEEIRIDHSSVPDDRNTDRSKTSNTTKESPPRDKITGHRSNDFVRVDLCATANE